MRQIRQLPTPVPARKGVELPVVFMCQGPVRDRRKLKIRCDAPMISLRPAALTDLEFVAGFALAPEAAKLK